ncbi:MULTISPECIES: IS5 family transposase [Methylococcus]|uniref:IS5 family transposase n=1 Tax=Methylococcus capsulatus TaxID=414 RepID=A0ABZ2F0L9_METCP|nr:MULTISPECIES: IS5 family transposase [Methylococcus]MDF9391511.1 IS5 family transposase [Methylococcus capsulatus]
MHTPTPTGFAELEYASKKRQTRREKFLAEMERVVPWALWLAKLEPHYPQSGRRGRQPMPLHRMLRIHCMQQWFSSSDRPMEDALYEIDSIRRFAGFGRVTEALADAPLLNFRHWLEKHQLTEMLLATVNDHLKDQGLLVSKGTRVDATISHAPSSPKNRDQARDPDMHPTKQGHQWYFGMKIPVGADVPSGAVHSVTVTAAHTADIVELPKRLREDDQVIFADAGYTSDEYKKGSRHPGLRWGVHDKRKPGKNLSSRPRQRNRQYASVRARVERSFRIIKCQFDFRKTPYRGLEKSTAQVNWRVGLANLYLLRRPWMAA